MILIFCVILVIVVCLFFFILQMNNAATVQHRSAYENGAADVGNEVKRIKSEIEINPITGGKLLRKYLIANPNDDTMHFLYAKLLYDQKKYADAIKHLESLVRSLPAREDMVSLLAKVYADYGLHNKSIENYKKVLKLDDKNCNALYMLAELYKKTSQLKLALNSYSKLISMLKSEDEVISVLQQMTLLYYKLGDYKNTVDCYKKILVYRPNDFEAMLNLKNLYKENNNFGEAVKILEKMCILRDKEYDLFEELIIMLYKSKRYEDVIEQAKNVVKYPRADICNIQNIIAKVYIKTQKVDESILLLNDIIKIHPKNSYLRQTLAQAYMQKKDFNEAITIYLDLIENEDASKTNILKSNLSSIYCNYGTELYKKNNHTAAFEKFAMALQYDADNPEIYYQVGYCNLMIKSYSDAINNIQKALDIEPTNLTYLLALADVYYEMDNLFEALKNYEAVLDIDSNNVKALTATGKIYAKQLNIEKAIECFKLCLEFEERNIDIHYNLALAYEYLSLKEAAIQEYLVILEIDPQNELAHKNLSMLNYKYSDNYTSENIEVDSVDNIDNSNADSQVDE